MLGTAKLERSRANGSASRCVSHSISIGIILCNHWDLETQVIMSHRNVGSSRLNDLNFTKDNATTSKVPSLRVVELFRHVCPCLPLSPLVLMGIILTLNRLLIR